jgi:hypothetical protein
VLHQVQSKASQQWLAFLRVGLKLPAAERR